MRIELVERLRCPQSGARLRLVEPIAQKAGDEIMEAELVTEDGKHRYPVRGGVPRFVPASNYADNFGMQWNHFSKTQLDSHSGHPISADRFWHATDWDPAELKGKWVLDIGCGSGRFAEVALNAGAHVVALDYSSAVDACFTNLKDQPNLHIVQGDMFALPFEPGSFPYVYSLGVIQHTPDVLRAFAGLPLMVEPGGKLCVDYYMKSWKCLVAPKYWLRPITKRIPKKALFSGIQTLLPALLGISRVVSWIPVGGKFLKRLVPVANYEGELPLSKTQIKEWALLDTFDWLAPEYDNPQTPKAVRMMMEKAGLRDIVVVKAGHLVGRGTR